MKNRIIQGKEVTKLMLSGINKIRDVAKTTLGPNGRNVMFLDKIGQPLASNDGLSSALQTVIDNIYEKMAADTIIDIAKRVKAEAGDASTTAIIVSSAIANLALKEIDKGADPNKLKAGILFASKEIVNELKNNSHKVETKEEALNIATISSESEDMGKMVSDIVWDVGENGTVEIEESNSFNTESIIVKGMQFEGGYVSPNMVTNNGTLESEIEDAFIIVIDGKITSNDNIQNILGKVMTAGKRECVMIANDFDGDVITMFSLNRLKGAFKTLAIKSSGFGNRKFDMLNDICLVTGATLISKELGIDLDKIEKKHFGRAKKIISSQTKTTIIDSAGSKEAIDKRIEELKVLVNSTEDNYEKDIIKNRIAKISGGIGLIKVGAKTELEMHYLKLKIKDAVRATQSAIQEGYIAGGGGVLYKIAINLFSWFSKNDFDKGKEAMLMAIREPFKQILKNAKRNRFTGLKMAWHPEIEYGYNAKENKFSNDLIKDGIIDPTKATRSVVEHSASGIATLITVGTLLDNEREK